MKPEHIFACITIVIGICVAYTAYNQYRLSKERFKLDLFEKRFSVYKGAQVFLSRILEKGKVDLDQIFQFRADTQDATFLFDADITEYLKAIDSKSLELCRINEELEGVPKSQKRSDMCREKTDVIHWLTSQLPILKEKFAPYLKFKTWR